MNEKPIRLNRLQRRRLFEYGVGVGILAYKCAEDMISQTEIYIDPQDRLCYVSNGKPVEFEVERDEDGLIAAVVSTPDDELTALRQQIEQLTAEREVLMRAVYHCMYEFDIHAFGFEGYAFTLDNAKRTVVMDKAKPVSQGDTGS